MPGAPTGTAKARRRVESPPPAGAGPPRGLTVLTVLPGFLSAVHWEQVSCPKLPSMNCVRSPYWAADLITFLHSHDAHQRALSGHQAPQAPLPDTPFPLGFWDHASVWFFSSLPVPLWPLFMHVFIYLLCIYGLFIDTPA